MAKLGFGKYAHLDLEEVPEDYLIWLIENSKQKVRFYEQELARRDMAKEATMDMVEKIVRAGYRELSKKLHPDSGGTNAAMQELNATYEKLKRGINKNPTTASPKWQDVKP